MYTYVAKVKKSINLFLYLRQKVQRYIQLNFFVGFNLTFSALNKIEFATFAYTVTLTFNKYLKVLTKLPFFV